MPHFHRLLALNLISFTLLGCSEPTPPATDTEPAQTGNNQPPTAATPNEPTTPNAAGAWEGTWTTQQNDQTLEVAADLTGYWEDATPKIHLLTFEPSDSQLLGRKRGSEQESPIVTVSKTNSGLELHVLESAAKTPLVKMMDPKTGLVVENSDREFALLHASTLVLYMQKPETAPTGRDYKAELQRIVQHYADSFHKIETGSFQTVTLNEAGMGFDAIRFRTPPADHNWDLTWEFVIDAKTSLNGFYIAARQGTVKGFTGYETKYDVSIDNVKIPADNMQITQSLTNGELKPDSEYIIWFAGDIDDPYPLTARIRFLPAN